MKKILFCLGILFLFGSVSPISAFDMSIDEDAMDNAGEKVDFVVRTNPVAPANAVAINIDFWGLKLLSVESGEGFLVVPKCENGEVYTDDEICVNIGKTESFEQGEELLRVQAEIVNPDYIIIETSDGSSYSDGEQQFEVSEVFYSNVDSTGEKEYEEDSAELAGLFIDRNYEILIFSAVIFVVFVVGVYLLLKRMEASSMLMSVFLLLSAFMVVVNSGAGVLLVYERNDENIEDLSVASTDSGYDTGVRYYGDYCSRGEYPVLIDTQTIDNSQKKVSYNLEAGKYALRPTSANTKLLKLLGLYIKFGQTGEKDKAWPSSLVNAGGIDPDFAWDTNNLPEIAVNPQREIEPDYAESYLFEIKDSWGNKKVTISSFLPKHPLSYRLVKCEKGSRADYSKYISCPNNGSASVYFDSEVRSPSSSNVSKNLEAGDYTVVVQGGTYYPMYDRTKNLSCAGSLVAYDVGNKSDVGAAGPFVCGFAGNEKTIIPQIAVGYGSDLTLNKSADVNFKLFYPSDGTNGYNDAQKAKSLAGNVDFVVYKCGVVTGITDTPDEPQTPIVPITDEPENIEGNCGSMDVNGDGKLTIIDFANFVKKYGMSCTDSSQNYNGCGGIDSNNDGKVNIIDFARFVKDYNKDSCSR